MNAELQNLLLVGITKLYEFTLSLRVYLALFRLPENFLVSLCLSYTVIVTWILTANMDANMKATKSTASIPLSHSLQGSLFQTRGEELLGLKIKRGKF